MCLEKLHTDRDLGVGRVVFRVQFPGQATILERLERTGDELIPELGYRQLTNPQLAHFPR